MNDPRRRLILAAICAAPFAALAQKPPAMARIGLLVPTTLQEWAFRIDTMRAGMRDLGYVEGKNIAIELRAAENRYERLAALAEELVALKVDLLVTGGTPAGLALKRATTTIPIVLTTVSDPVATGIVLSLARPGGNITGSMFFVQELGVKRLEMLQEALPRLKRVAVLMNADNVSMVPVERAMMSAAKQLGVEMQRHDVRSPADFDGAFAAMAAKRAEAVVVIEDSMLNVNTEKLGALATAKRLASIGAPPIVLGGGLLSYGVDQAAMDRRVAYFIDRILKGAKPADLPIERSTKFVVTVNMKAAKALGVTVPPSILVRADRVIE